MLLVEPTYRPDGLTPGGTAEADEPPAGGAAREVLEELGVALPIGRPLAMQWLRGDDDPDGVLHFAYDGGAVDGSTVSRFRLPPDELRSFRFVAPADVGPRVRNDGSLGGRGAPSARPRRLPGARRLTPASSALSDECAAADERIRH